MSKLILMSTAFAVVATVAGAGERVTYTVGDAQFDGYVAQAENPRGTIVILPTWNGLSDYEMDRAQMLADLGFTTFAADLYPAGQQPKTMEARQTGLQAVTSEQERLHEILTAAINEARKHGAEPLLVMGYSMGALVAMELAWSGLGNELEVDAYAIFSGRVSVGQGRILPDGVAPFFVAIGDSDERVPVSTLVNFTDDVDLAGGSLTAHTYAGAGHLFSAFGFPNYNEGADQQSWEDYSAFLDDFSE